MTRKDDINVLVSLKFLLPWAEGSPENWEWGQSNNLGIFSKQIIFRQKTGK